MKAHVTTDASKFRITVNHLLQEFGQDCYVATRVAVQETADVATNKLRHAVSKPKNFEGTKYRASWTNQVRQTSISTEAIIYNKKHYRLTHLLEFGHAIRVGGRKIGDVEAYQHIEPINKEVDAIFQQKMEDILGRKL